MTPKTKISLLIGCLTVLSLLAATPALAVTEHLYDPTLSLTGGTATSVEDMVPDPGPIHPTKGFNVPCAAATDRYGDIYVSNRTPQAYPSDGVIDVFDATGRFLTEIPDEHLPCSLALDSAGNLYATRYEPATLTVPWATSNVVRYEPNSFPPEAETTYTLADTFEFIPSSGTTTCTVAAQSVSIDPSDDHLYIGHACSLEEYASADEGSGLIDDEAVTIDEGLFGSNSFEFTDADVYGANHDLYAIARRAHANPPPDKIFVYDGTDGHVKCEIGGVPSGGGTEPFEFGPAEGSSIAVDQSTGDVYVYDIAQSHLSGAAPTQIVYQFSVGGTGCDFVGRLPQPPTLNSFEGAGDLVVDDPIHTGEAGYNSPSEGYVFVTSGKVSATSHLFAFRPKANGPPEVRAQTTTGVGETEAVLKAELNPDALETSYHFQYTTQAAYKARGYEGAANVPVPDAELPQGGAFVSVSEPVEGLEAGADYHFRLVASNCGDPEALAGECLTEGAGNPGGEGADASFATYPTPPAVSLACANAALRVGASKDLPDCRAYELVTPPDTGGHVPTLAMLGLGFGTTGFTTAAASADGLHLLYGSNTGTLPGLEIGNGGSDTYQATRQPGSGWHSRFTGLTAAQTGSPRAGGVSADQHYSFWATAGSQGTLDPGSAPQASYLMVPAGSEPSPNCAPAAEPEGHVEWTACGSLGHAEEADGQSIRPGGEHVIFTSEQHLEPCASPAGETVYDRAPGGPTRCASLLPGGSAPAPGAVYMGVSADGSAVAFAVRGETGLYVRRDAAETFEVAADGATFGGLSDNGDWAFYLQGGDIFACDLSAGGCAGGGAHAPIPVGSGGESTLVNVSADGSHVYFVSDAVLTGSEENEFGARAESGEENLYVWDGSSVNFMARVAPADVTGDPGLGEWVLGVLNTNPNPVVGAASDPSRTTPDGAIIVFESTANLTDYDSAGRRQVYRYSADAEPGQRLLCLSCNPTGAPAASDAQLQSPGNLTPQTSPLPPLASLAPVANVSADGQRVFFQTPERLVSRDLDGFQDVYEWESHGVGGCGREAGCLTLISGAESAQDDYLFAATSSGDDVFFLSADMLNREDPDGTFSIYDARVEGGFPVSPPPPGECLGEACQPAVVAPEDASPATSGEKPGNPKGGAKPCPKGKVRKHRKCVRRHRHRRAHAKRRAHR